MDVTIAPEIENIAPGKIPDGDVMLSPCNKSTIPINAIPMPKYPMLLSPSLIVIIDRIATKRGAVLISIAFVEDGMNAKAVYERRGYMPNCKLPANPDKESKLNRLYMPLVLIFKRGIKESRRIQLINVLKKAICIESIWGLGLVSMLLITG